MKKIPFILLVLALSTPAITGDYEKLEKLREEKRKIAVQMHHKRVELIKNTPSLMELQKQIISLHKELSIRVDNNSEMRELINKQREVEAQIRLLEMD
ncbi:MAG: hypothetical protein JW808_00280 [Victivallales bacterium]|nr:hypothetical protein [Victivallales bacterium]